MGAVFGYLVIAFLLVVMFVIIAECGKDSYDEGWRTPKEQRFVDDITSAIRDEHPAQTEKEQFMEIYMEQFNTDEKTAEHAYKNTDKAVREAIIKQYGGKK